VTHLHVSLFPRGGYTVEPGSSSRADQQSEEVCWNMSEEGSGTSAAEKKVGKKSEGNAEIGGRKPGKKSETTIVSDVSCLGRGLEKHDSYRSHLLHAVF